MSARILRPWRADPVLTVLVVVALALKVVFFNRVADLPLRGDEVAYRDAGCAIANLIRDLAGLNAPDGGELSRDLVGSGWFMPGMGLVLAPLYLLVPDAGDPLARMWLGLVSGAVFVVAVVEVRRALGRPFAIALCVFPAMVPVWVLLSLTAYGDLLAGLVLVVLLGRLLEVVTAGRAGEGGPSLREGALLGFLGIAVVYLRSSAVLAVAFIAVAAASVLLWTLVRSGGWTRARGSVISLAVASGVFVGLLLPWSIGASAALDDRIITTTTVPTAMANTFGDREQVCFGPCDPGSTVWFAPVRYAREVARATGDGEVTVLGQMSAYARQDVTPRSYSDDVIDNLDRYRNIDGFGAILKPPDAPHDEGVWQWVARDLSLWMFRPVSWLAALALLVVSRRRYGDQVVAVFVKLGLLALLSQPFVHLGGSRYWTTAGALGGLAVVLLARMVWGTVRKVEPEPGDEPSRLLTAVQWLLSAVAVAAVATVAVLA